MANNNRTCVVCGRSYKSCKTDEVEKIGHYRWRNSCDKPECFQALMILSDFNYDRISKAEAKQILDTLLTDEMLPYDPNAKTLIDKIYAPDLVVELAVEEPIEQAEMPLDYETISEPEIPVVETSDVAVEIVEEAVVESIDEVVTDVEPTFESEEINIPYDEYEVNTEGDTLY